MCFLLWFFVPRGWGGVTDNLPFPPRFPPMHSPPLRPPCSLGAAWEQRGGNETRLLPNVDSSCKFGVWAITSSLGWRHRESSSTCLHGGCGAESHLVCHVHPLPFLRKRVSPLPPLPALFLQPSGAESHLWACLKSNPRPSFRPLWVSGSLSLEGTHPTPGEWGRQTACAHLKT